MQYYESDKNTLDWLKRWIEQYGDAYHGYRFRAVFDDIKDTINCYAAVIDAFQWDKQIVPCRVESQNYKTAILYESWLNGEGIIDLFENAVQGFIDIDDKRVELKGKRDYLEKLHAFGDNNFITKSGYAVRLGLGNIGYRYEPLISSKYPYYQNIQDAALEWLTSDSGIKNNASVFQGNFTIILPEVRAYIHDIHAESEGLIVTLGGDELNDRAYKLVGQWTGLSQSHKLSEIVNGNLCCLAVPSTLEGLEFYLVDEQDQVYDGSSENPWHISGRGLEESLKNAVTKQGEGENIEFKKFIRPDHQKMQELARTVVAFANTSGGLIYIGVDDNCQIVGIDKELPGLFKKDNTDYSNWVDLYLGKIKAKLNDGLGKIPDYEVKKIIIEDKTVVAIDVSTGNKKPYYLKNNIPYVRRGASTMVANPDLDNAIFKMNNLPG